LEDIFGKSSIISLTGGHIGPPLQRRENLLNKDVGEYLRVLPERQHGTICQENLAIAPFFRGIIIWRVFF